MAQSMDDTSGAGTDAMKIYYVKKLINNTNDIPELIGNITTFLNNMANGKLPDIIANHIGHSRAISGRKLKKEHMEKEKIRYDEHTQHYYKTNYLC